MRTILGTTPICITYRRGPDRPSIHRSRRFVGWRRLVKNAIGLVSDMIESIAFETEERMELPENTVSVHWALEVDDPWGLSNESSLVAVKVPECPPAGTHFEIFKLDPSLKKREPRLDPANEPPTVAHKNGHMNQEQIHSKLRSAILNRGLFDPEAGLPEL